MAPVPQHFSPECLATQAALLRGLHLLFTLFGLLVNQLEFFYTVYLKFSCPGVTPVTNLNIFYFIGLSHLDMVLIFFSKPNVNRDVMLNYPSCELIVKHQAGHAPLFLLRDNPTTQPATTILSKNSNGSTSTGVIYQFYMYSTSVSTLGCLTRLSSFQQS